MSDIETAMAEAAAAGTAAAAKLYAQALEAAGETASVGSAPDGSASVVIEGAGALAREFGAHQRPPRPVLGPLLQANRAAMLSAAGDSMADALRRSR